MNFDDYQSKAATTTTYRQTFDDLCNVPQANTFNYGAYTMLTLAYPSLALAGEAGEVANEIKKVMRSGDFVLTHEKREAIVSELGDCLWYIAALCSELGVSMAGVAQQNLDKLQRRYNAVPKASSV